MAESGRSAARSHRGGESGPPKRVQFWLDIASKVLGGVAVAAVTYLGYRIQSTMSEISIRNQREQAETALRASMLGDLVGPIAGGTSASKSGEIDLRHERLLAELVTLNFHDHFEFKPVLAEIDEKISKLKALMPLLVVALTLLLSGWMTFTFAMIALLHAAFMPSPYAWLWASLIVTVVYMVIGGAVGWFAYAEIKATSFTPTRTLKVLQQDQVWIQNEARTA